MSEATQSSSGKKKRSSGGSKGSTKSGGGSAKKKTSGAKSSGGAKASSGKKGSESTAAAKAMDDAMKRGDVKAARQIGKTFLRLEKVKENLASERAQWRERINAAWARLEAAVQQDDDGSVESAREKLNDIIQAYQEYEEAEAGKKSALTPIMEEQKELKAKLKRQVEGANQLGLFD